MSVVALRSGGSDDSTAASGLNYDRQQLTQVRVAKNEAPTGGGSGSDLTLPPAPPESLAPVSSPPATTVTVAPTTASTAAPTTAAPTTAAPVVAPATVAPMAPPATAPKGQTPAGHDHDDDMVHNYVDHVVATLGAQMLTVDQGAYGGYQWVGTNLIEARSPITGLAPVIDQAISDVKKKDPSLSGEALERRIAQRLTELNDWENLTDETQAEMMVLSGLDIDSMRKREREERVNHLLHSPLPFGDLAEVLTPDVKIDLSYTHTLDKDKTKVVDLGDGVFQVWMVSNNNDGSHTGHSLGSFKVQLPAGTSLDEARRIGNSMVKNKNKNEKLYLAQAARNVLYGQTPPPADQTPAQTTSTTAMASTSTTAAAPETMPTVSTTSSTTPSSTAMSTTGSTAAGSDHQSH